VMPRAAGFLPALALVLAASAFPAAGDGVRPLDPAPDPTEVVLLENGLWRYADAAGPRCTDIAHVGVFCAIPSDWAPLPGDPDRITQDQVVRLIQGRVTGPDGAMMGQQQGTVSSAAGRELITTPFIAADTVLISLTEVNGRVVIAETREYGTTLVNRRHRAAHEAFLDGLTLAETW
jgi:hypothetical protein